MNLLGIANDSATVSLYRVSQMLIKLPVFQFDLTLHNNIRNYAFEITKNSLNTDLVQDHSESLFSTSSIATYATYKMRISEIDLTLTYEQLNALVQSKQADWYTFFLCILYHGSYLRKFVSMKKCKLVSTQRHS